jgi:hypothetical protein
MLRKILLSAVAVTLTLSTINTASAIPVVLPNGQIIDLPMAPAPSGVTLPTGQVLQLPTTQVITLPNGAVINVPQTAPVPVLTTPTLPTGLNPTTGGINTAGTTILNTALQPGRLESMNNGTLKQVSRPILDAQGKVVGFEQGVEWINSLTGQRHFETNAQTANGLGGINTQKVQGLMAPKLKQ